MVAPWRIGGNLHRCVLSGQTKPQGHTVWTHDDSEAGKERIGAWFVFVYYKRAKEDHD